MTKMITKEQQLSPERKLTKPLKKITKYNPSVAVLIYGTYSDFNREQYENVASLLTIFPHDEHCS